MRFLAERDERLISDDDDDVDDVDDVDDEGAPTPFDPSRYEHDDDYDGVVARNKAREGRTATTKSISARSRPTIADIFRRQRRRPAAVGTIAAFPSCRTTTVRTCPSYRRRSSCRNATTATNTIVEVVGTIWICRRDEGRGCGRYDPSEADDDAVGVRDRRVRIDAAVGNVGHHALGRGGGGRRVRIPPTMTTTTCRATARRRTMSTIKIRLTLENTLV